jgi:hypothetical protein
MRPRIRYATAADGARIAFWSLGEGRALRKLLSFKTNPPFWIGLTLLLGLASATLAHDPIFSPGPHVLYKGGVEIHTGFEAEKAGDERELEAAVELTYGLTGDWVAGAELPYVDKRSDVGSVNGLGDLQLFTKYRFWRQDTLGAQDSAAAFVKLKLDTADGGGDPSRGTGSTDATFGLTYGHESLKWYRWASVRYRLNGKNDAGLERGNKVFLDLVGGIRLSPPRYREPDTVWLLELNGEYTEHAQRNGVDIADSGGTELFLSPGIFWTERNFAIKSGVQIPIFSDLNGNQDNSDYRARLIFEWHL